MGLRKLEEKMEVLRTEMEKSSMCLGLAHPKVYRLSRQLDQLHNQWQQVNGQSVCQLYQMVSLI